VRETGILTINHGITNVLQELTHLFNSMSNPLILLSAKIFDGLLQGISTIHTVINTGDQITFILQGEGTLNDTTVNIIVLVFGWDCG